MKNENELKPIVENMIWMAARYAHGRHTYAPGMVRQAVADMQKLFPDWKPQKDDTIKPPKEEPKGMSFRSDYLDDIFNPNGH